MYQALLTRRYLFSKVMPLLSVLAVTLCTAMVLVVWSVMGGFLNMLLTSGKSMIGDVSITWPVVGIPSYDKLIDRLEKDPMIAGATPIIETLGLLVLTSGDTRNVQVIGVDPAGYQKVTSYYDRLWWRPLETPLKRDKAGADPRLAKDHAKTLQSWFEHGQTLREPDPRTGLERPAIALGIEIARPNNERTTGGFVVPRYYYMANREVTLSVLPLSQKGVTIDARAARFPVANEFRTGLYEADANWVIVPLDELQRLLKMDRAERLKPGEELGHGRLGRDKDGKEVFLPPTETVIEPARATTVLIKAAPGVTPEALRDRAAAIYSAFWEETGQTAPPPNSIPIFTWETKPGLETFIAAVKKETALVLVLFGFISLTAVFLVFAIFWSMISEKTKDIGVLRAIGASRAGVAWLFLRYGLAIGVSGAVSGGVLAWLVVTNINPIHEWMGERLGIQIWDPRIYYFNDIPNVVEWDKAAMVMGFGVLSSVVGALIPAVRAAWMDPVKALRFE